MCGGGWANTVYQTKPDAAPKPKPAQPKVTYTYVGCFKDAAQRVFSHDSQLDPNSVSPATCGAWAASKGYPYFGMQVGRECRGGDKYDTKGKADNCNVPVRARTHTRFARARRSVSCVLLSR